MPPRSPASRFQMKGLIAARLLLLLLMGALGACSPSEPELPQVRVVTVVVTPTTGPTQTPIVITEVQTVVVTAAPTTTRPTRPTRTPRAASPTPEEPLTPTATDTASPTGAAAPPPATRRPPTRTPRPAPALRYAAPQLETPLDGETFSSGVQPFLSWSALPLAEDEYYEVTIERLWQNQPYYSGSDWVKEPQLWLPLFVRGTSDTQHYTWWVTVKRLTGTNSAGGKVGEAVSPPSAQRTFTWFPE